MSKPMEECEEIIKFKSLLQEVLETGRRLELSGTPNAEIATMLANDVYAMKKAIEEKGVSREFGPVIDIAVREMALAGFDVLRHVPMGAA